MCSNPAVLRSWICTDLYQNFEGKTVADLLASGWVDISTSPRHILAVNNIDGRDVLLLQAWGGNVIDMDAGIEYRGLNAGLSTVWSVEYNTRDLTPITAIGGHWAVGVGEQDYWHVNNTTVAQFGVFGAASMYSDYRIHTNKIGQNYAVSYGTGFPGQQFPHVSH